MTATLDFTSAPIPNDTPPPTAGVPGDYDPQYPGSTKEAPYGYFTEGPKAGEPRKNRPRGTGSASGSRMPANDTQASTAAGLLASMNNLVGISLTAFGLPLTGVAIASANEQFEVMAKNALLTDPALCRKILNGGVTSGKAGLVMAYGALGIVMLPVAQSEIKAKRLAREAEIEGDLQP